MVNCDSLMGDLFMVKGDDIEERLIDFAVRIIGVCDALPDKPAGRHVRGQLLRSGTSPAPNYGEACGAESSKDFVHTLSHHRCKHSNRSEIDPQLVIHHSRRVNQLTVHHSQFTN